MPIFTRVNGGASAVAATGGAIVSNVDSAGTTIATGIGKPIQGFNILSNVSLATEFGAGERIESILGAVARRATVLAYQVDTANCSVIIEQSDWNATDLQANINSVLTGASVTVTETGLRLR